MDYSYLKSIINEVKSSHSCFDFLKFHCNIFIPHVAAAINCPPFIRSGDNHPSFAVYHHICIDFSTGNHYDIIALVQLALNLNFSDALEYLAGRKIFHNHQAQQFNSQHQSDAKALNDKIAFWHSELLNNQQALDYLHSRKISDNTINNFMLGYSKNLHKIIFPFARKISSGVQFVYYAGRDDSPFTRQGLTPRYQLDRKDNDYAPKYQKAKLSSNSIYENIAFGGQTLRPHTTTKHTYFADDGQEYDTGELDPRDNTLCILEGLVDALSFMQEGWQVQSPGGGHFSQSYIKELLDLARNYERVFICFDNDNAGDNFRKAMCKLFFQHRIHFICGHVPHEVNGRQVKDVSDYYCAGGDLAELVRKARNGIIDMAQDVQSDEELEELFTGAAKYLSTPQLLTLREKCYDIPGDEEDECTHIRRPRFSQKVVNAIFKDAIKPLPEQTVAQMVAENHTIRFDVSGSYYEYTRGIWREVSEYIIHKYVGEVLNAKASSRRMAAVTHYIRGMNADYMNFNSGDVLCFPNGTLHLNEPDPAKAFRPHDANDMCTIMMNYMYTPGAVAIKWLKFIDDICGGDPAKKRLLQQIAGYIMFPNNRLQKFFYLVGDGRNGKSVYANILEQVYGSENCSSVPPSRMNSQFDPIALKNSLLNICYEAKSVLNGSEEVIKAVASGDPITAAHKGVDAVSFKTRAKLMVLANRVWASQDVSYGFLRRILFIKFDRQFMGDQDNRNLYSELIKELPGIFNWCYEGYRDLMETGEFQELDDQAKILEELTENMSPVSAFVREVLCNEELARQYTDKNPDEREIYHLYKEWSNDGNFKPLNRIEFMKDVSLLLRQRDYGVKVRSRSDAKCKEFVFTSVPEAETLEQEGTQREDGRIIALGGVSFNEETAPAESACEESTQAEREDEAVSAGAHDVAEVGRDRDSRNNDVMADCADTGPAESIHLSSHKEDNTIDAGQSAHDVENGSHRENLSGTEAASSGSPVGGCAAELAYQGEKNSGTDSAGDEDTGPRDRRASLASHLKTDSSEEDNHAVHERKSLLFVYDQEPEAAGQRLHPVASADLAEHDNGIDGSNPISAIDDASRMNSVEIGTSAESSGTVRNCTPIHTTAPGIPVRKFLKYPAYLEGTPDAARLDYANYLLSLYAWRTDPMRRDEMKAFTVQEWQKLKEIISDLNSTRTWKELKAMGLDSPEFRDFKTDYMYYMRRHEVVEQNNHGYAVCDINLDHGANLYGYSDEDMYRFALLYMNKEFKPETGSEWDMLAVFFQHHREIEPPYFKDQYAEHTKA